MTTSNIDYNRILTNLMLNGIVTFATPAIIVFLSRWVNPIWMPALTVAFIPLLIAYGFYSSRGYEGACTLTRRYTEYGLGVSALIMILINLSNTQWAHNMFGFSQYDGRIPFVPAVIIFPTITFFKIVQLFRLGKTSYCHACAASSRATAERSLAMGIYDTQTRYMTRLTIRIFLFESVVILVYFFTSYINVNYSASDTFFFFVFPLLAFVASSIYVYMRFESLRFGASTLGIKVKKSKSLHVRFLVIKGDTMLMHEMPTEMPGMTFWDTPAVKSLPNETGISDTEAREIFTDLSGTDDFSIRRLYHDFDNATKDDVDIFAVFLNDDAIVCGLHGEWLNLYAIDRLYNTGRMSAPMSYDIRRIYMITMAWKTYTREGKRLYPIKNYRPTFLLSDLKNWDVDYNDIHWFDIYKVNEDTPFWRLRKFWRRYVTGVSTKLEM